VDATVAEAEAGNRAAGVVRAHTWVAGSPAVAGVAVDAVGVGTGVGTEEVLGGREGAPAGAMDASESGAGLAEEECWTLEGCHTYYIWGQLDGSCMCKPGSSISPVLELGRVEVLAVACCAAPVVCKPAEVSLDTEGLAGVEGGTEGLVGAEGGTEGLGVAPVHVEGGRQVDVGNSLVAAGVAVAVGTEAVRQLQLEDGSHPLCSQ